MKYPRTPHLEWSLGASDDDTWFNGDFSGKQIVVTEKLDGESSGLTNIVCHARSLDSKDHPSRHWLKRLHSEIKHEIPSNFKIFGENVFAKHSIFYNKLTTYFYVYSIWVDKMCLSWEETKEWASLFGLKTVPVLYEGIWNETLVKSCWTGRSVFGDQQEGYVVRVQDGFCYEQFNLHLAKMVRKNHIQTDEHWLDKPVFPNCLK